MAVMQGGRGGGWEGGRGRGGEGEQKVRRLQLCIVSHVALAGPIIACC